MKRYDGICSVGTAVIESMPFHVCKELTIIYILENDINFTTAAGTKTLREGDLEILNVKEPIQLECVISPCKVLYYSFQKEYTDLWPENFEWITYNCLGDIFFGAQASKENIEMLRVHMLRVCRDVLDSAHRDVILRESEAMLNFIRNHFDDIAHIFVENKCFSISKERFQRISAYMISRVSERISLRDIANEEHLSLPYLSKEFSEKLEKNFNSMMNYYRVINALILLLTTDYTLTYIAEHTGFSSTRYYHRSFEMFLHCTPGQFRKRHKGKTAKVVAAHTDAAVIGALLEKGPGLQTQTFSVELTDGVFHSTITNENEETIEYVVKMKLPPGTQFDLEIRQQGEK